MITHRNILANMVPIEHEIAKYQRYTRPFKPLRFLNLLPLSHMFGQSMATFIPPMLEGQVVFMRSYAPQDIIRQVHDRRISVIVCVPKILEVLRDYVAGRLAPRSRRMLGLYRENPLDEAVVDPSRHSPDVRVQVLGICRWRGAARS